MRKRLTAPSLFLLLCTAAALAQLPHGWELSTSSPASYVAAVDRTVFHTGHASGSLRSTTAVARRNFAVLSQSMSALRFIGHKLRLSGYLRTADVQGWAGMWMRVDAPHGSVLEFDNMQNRPVVGTTSWTRYDVDLNVPQESDRISFGALLAGPGEVWMDDVTFEMLGTALPGTNLLRRLRGDSMPVNLDFEGGL